MTTSPFDLTPDALRAESAALRNLARALLGSDDAADDVTQQTWVAALENDSARVASPSAWLRRVARNFALRRHRDEALRNRRELAVPPDEPAPDSAEVLARVELHRRVVTAVLALDAPYRETVLLRFWEGLPPRDIAIRMDVPVRTVHTRLQRAADRLRSQLDRETGGRAAWAPLLASVGTPTPAASVTATAATAKSTAAVFGVLTMSKLLCSLAALAVIAIAWTSWEFAAQSGAADRAMADAEPHAARSQLARAEEGTHPAADSLQESPSTRVEVEGSVDQTVTNSAAPAQPLALRTYAVRVVEHDGSPAAGVRVRILPASLGPSLGSHVHESLGTEVVTDAAGLATSDSDTIGVPSGDDRTCTAFVREAVADWISTPVDPAASEVPTLRLPPTGVVNVRVACPTPWVFEKCRVALLGQRFDALRSSTLDATQAVRALDAEGRAQFERVAVGSDFQLLALVPESRIRASITVQGPRSPGETVEATISLFGERQVLLAALVDHSGRALADTEVGAVVFRGRRDGELRDRSAKLTTDAEGRIALETVSTLGAAYENRLELLTTGHPRLSARVILPSILRGANDLGTIALRTSPLLCGGVVQDADGHPVPDARINLIDTAPGELRSDAEGRFAIRGNPSDPPHRLRVEHPEYQAITTEFRPGTTDLVVTLLQTATLRGRVLLSDDAARRFVDVAISAPGVEMPQRMGILPADGSFCFTGLKPTEVTVTARVFGAAQPTVTTGPILLGKGRVTDVGELDLRGRTHPIAFRIRCADGSTPASLSAVILGAARPEGTVVLAGRGSLVASAPRIGLRIWGPGYQTTDVLDVVDGAEVAIAPAYEVEFSVPTGLHVPPGTVLQVWADPQVERVRSRQMLVLTSGNGGFTTGDLTPWIEHSNCTVDLPAARARMTLTWPGPHSIRVRLAHTQREDSRSVQDGLTLDPTRLVPTQLVELRLDQAQIDAAAARLR